MKFDEEFPELKDLADYPYDNGCRFFDLMDIKKYCKSNQKIKEAIEKIKKRHHNDIYYFGVLNEILEELNLNDDLK